MENFCQIFICIKMLQSIQKYVSIHIIIEFYDLGTCVKIRRETDFIQIISLTVIW